nr:GNAT family N-acetyltransferase [Pacificoceanicola onchidii]
MTGHLRPGEPRDALRLGAILSGFTDETDWMPRLHSRAEDISHMGGLIDRGWVTVADRGDGPFGFLACDHKTIHALYVDPEQRGQGAGKALLDHAKESASLLELWTFQANTGAQRFYEREGFSEAERTDGATNDEKLPDIRYVWQRPNGGVND